MLYDILIKPFVRKMSADDASKWAMGYFRFINSIPGGRAIYRRIHGNRPAGMERTVWGLDFYNPVGLGAGFDLKGELYNDLNSLGFSYVEIGPLNAEYTTEAVRNIQDNPPKDILAACIEADFSTCFSLAYDFCDFFTIDVADLEHIDKVIDPLTDIRLTYDDYKPIVVRVPEDATGDILDGALKYCLLSGVDGVCTRSLAQTREVHSRTEGRLEIIANAHITMETEASDLLDAGASLVELRSGLVHRGPSFARRVIQFLEKQAHAN